MNNIPADLDVVKALESLLAEVQHLEQDYPEDYDFKRYRDVLAYHPDQGTIADVPMDLSAHPHNARLIAAAPELLEALEWIVNEFVQSPEWLDPKPNSPEEAWFSSARSAIAKAKGTL